MIWSIAILLGCQLAGEIVTRFLGLPLPGPVLGMALLLGLLVAIPRLYRLVAPTGHTILANLSLLFVPAGVGVVANLDVVSEHGLALLTAVVVSTVLALVAGVLSFRAVARLMERQE
ncbi:CidA/LrgA family protein [Tropicimonas sp. IMCC34043]|uniref:CidA/LrgA family protein n=1 Tax=Tropicimonas sp. IMCC34043 TaxID=2248760 RepID=UPI000E256583|nr:CidA/LrgA family protein [Tropicimonas sp. IMCC34043]